jgi:hypothetical protein
MLNLTPTPSALSTFHTRFLDSDLPSELSTAAFERFDASTYDGEVLARGRNAWELRTMDEYRSQVAFTELLFELTQMGFAFDVLGTGVRVVRDEARHVELCKRMVVALGGSPRMEGTPHFVRSSRNLPPRIRILRTIVGSLCIGETISVKLLAAVRDNTTDPLARAVVTCLTADESIHSRFGWTLLGLLAPHLTAEERADIANTLPHYLAATASVVAASSGRAPSGDHPLASAPANPFGSLPAKARSDVFMGSLENDIFRGFDEFDIDARRAWTSRACK